MNKGEYLSPQQAQEIALAEAVKGMGFVSPNPLVGCVFVDRNHRFLSSGYHARLGGDHAEIDALKKLSQGELQGATVYVTLEPCAHEGRTPSCAKRLAQTPITKVVAALLDPNPLVAGQGFEILKQRGIAVEIDSAFGEKAKILCEEFLWHISYKIPYVSLKVATSLDGKMALANGQSQWITSEQSRQYARYLRGAHDATMIGAGTLLKDNPILDFRDTPFAGLKKNRVVVWDPKNKAQDFLPQSRLVQTLGAENVLLMTQPMIDLAFLKELYSKGIYSLYVEGGAYAQSQLIQQGLYQKLYQFIAPVLLGQGLSFTDHLRIDDMAQKRELRFHKTQSLGPDLLVTAYPQRL